MCKNYRIIDDMDTIEFATTLNNTNLRFDELHNQIKRFKRLTCTVDLKRLLETSSKFRELISKELVECRRVKQITAKSQTLLISYVQSVATLDEYVTFGILLNG